MKKYLAGISACAVAVLLFAFATPKGTITCFDQNASLVWFIVPGSVASDDCSVQNTQVTPVASIAGAVTTAASLNPTLQNCPAGDEILCAVGYTNNASDFELITSGPDAGKHRPKSNVQPVCCIKKP